MTQHLINHFLQLEKKIQWDCVCDEMERTLPDLKLFLSTWGPNCGAPYMVFRGQLCKTFLRIWEKTTN